VGFLKRSASRRERGPVPRRESRDRGIRACEQPMASYRKVESYRSRAEGGRDSVVTRPPAEDTILQSEMRPHWGGDGGPTRSDRPTRQCDWHDISLRDESSL